MSEEAQTKADKAPAKETPKSFLIDILYVAFFFIIFTSFGWMSFHIPSSSMEPTLEVGDRIFVSKWAYGYNRYSLPFDPALVPEDKIFDSLPDRGDVVVFTLPHKDTDYIKRLIGLPGDRIQMKNGRLFINDRMVQRQFVRDVSFTDYRGTPLRVKEYIERLPASDGDGFVEHAIYERSDAYGSVDNTDLYIVPAGHVFMMGDNRDGSADSRFLGDMGFVKAEYLVGRADVTTFSLFDCDQGKPIYCLGPVPLGRFFNVIR